MKYHLTEASYFEINDDHVHISLCGQSACLTNREFSWIAAMFKAARSSEEELKEMTADIETSPWTVKKSDMGEVLNVDFGGPK